MGYREFLGKLRLWRPACRDCGAGMAHRQVGSAAERTLGSVYEHPVGEAGLPAGR